VFFLRWTLSQFIATILKIMPSSSAKKGGLFDDDCDRPSCDDIKQALPKSMEEFQALTKKHAAKKKVECPLRSAELGRSSWNLLHTMVRACV
jgi:hypothetical protein